MSPLLPDQAQPSETSSLEPESRASRAPTPFSMAVAMLARREHSQLQMVRKLVAKGVDDAAAARVVQDLAERGYQSDARFGDMLARTRIADGCGPLRIRADLRVAGIGDALVGPAIAGALDYHAAAWIDVAREALRRRGLAARTGLAAERRAFALLQRRGFDGDTIRAALRQDCGGDPDR